MRADVKRFIVSNVPDISENTMMIVNLFIMDYLKRENKRVKDLHCKLVWIHADDRQANLLWLMLDDNNGIVIKSKDTSRAAWSERAYCTEGKILSQAGL